MKSAMAVQMVPISSEYIMAEGRRVHMAPGQNCKLILLNPYKCELIMIVFPDWDRKEQIFFPQEDGFIQKSWGYMSLLQ